MEKRRFGALHWMRGIIEENTCTIPILAIMFLHYAFDRIYRYWVVLVSRSATDITRPRLLSPPPPLPSLPRVLCSLTSISFYKEYVMLFMFNVSSNFNTFANAIGWVLQRHLWGHDFIVPWCISQSFVAIKVWKELSASPLGRLEFTLGTRNKCLFQ